jgi:hypothetical protein
LKSTATSDEVLTCVDIVASNCRKGLEVALIDGPELRKNAQLTKGPKLRDGLNQTIGQIKSNDGLQRFGLARFQIANCKKTGLFFLSVFDCRMYFRRCFTQGIVLYCPNPSHLLGRLPCRRIRHSVADVHDLSHSICIVNVAISAAVWFVSGQPSG